MNLDTLLEYHLKEFDVTRGQFHCLGIHSKLTLMIRDIHELIIEGMGI